MTLYLATSAAGAAELLPFPAQAPVQKQPYGQTYSQDIEPPASVFADKYADFSDRISSYSCADLDDLMDQLEDSHANAQGASKDYYKGLVDITSKKRLDLNCH